MFSSPLVSPLNDSVIGMNRYGSLMPDVANLLAWYKGNIADGKLVAYYPYSNHTTQQVKSSGFAGAGSATVTGLLTTDTITASGPSDPTCTVDGTLTFPGVDCWDIDVYRDGVLWAYWPGINVGPPVEDPPITNWTELDASGNGHHLTGLVGTTITERVDGTGTNYKNESGFASCIAAPDGFTYPADLPAIHIHVDDNGVASVLAFDITAGMPTGKAYYVSTTGSDANDGLTAGSPLATIGVAMGKVDVDVIYVATGTYIRSKAFTVAATRSVSIIATGGTVTTNNFDALTWSADSTYTNLSKATRSTVYAVYDNKYLTADGDSTKLLKCNTIELCAATIGSWFTDNVSVWVNPSDERVADADIRAFLDVRGILSNGKNIYIEGFNILGGGLGVCNFTNTTSTLTHCRAKNCTFRYGKDSLNGVARVYGKIAAVFENCVAAHGASDGFNYHLYVGIDVAPVALEINCIGRNNGDGGDIIDNGSTMHDGGTIIRVGGEYYHNNGPNVIDYNSSKSWNIGVNAHDSLAAGEPDYRIWGDMWLHSCTGGSFDEYDETSTIYAYDTDTGTEASTPYTPTAGLALPIVFGGPLTTPGPLGIDATITEGTTYPAITIKAPLGAEFQAIPEFTGEAVVDLATLAPTAKIRTGLRGVIVRSVDGSAEQQARDDRVVGA